MTKQILPLRKQRTRQHVIADLSAHHVEGYILEVGHVAQRLSPDYSYRGRATTKGVQPERLWTSFASESDWSVSA